jgi:DNA-3-methyladenine glycosylase I
VVVPRRRAGAALAGRLARDDARSEALSKELRKAGFRFVGPTTVYSTMQACGVVNDHLATCPARAATERARQAVGTPG